MRSSKFCAMFLLGLAVAACALPTGKAPRVLQGSAFATTYTLSLACSLDAARARELAESSFARVDAAMSTYRQDSELMRLNRTAPFEWLAISADFASVVKASIELASLTDGAFDPTLGRLVRLWGFGGGDVPDVVPAEPEIARLRAASGWNQVEFDEPGARVRRLSDFALDLSAIAKGYAVDLAMEALQEEGCQDFLLEVGGEVGVRGRRADGATWVLGVESPDSRGGVALALEISQASIATSGDYRNRLRIGDTVFSHTLDPATGRPVAHNLASVSVIAATAMRADALATALNVMGPERGRAFAEAFEIEAYFIFRTDSGYDSFATGRFQAMQERLEP